MAISERANSEVGVSLSRDRWAAAGQRAQAVSIQTNSSHEQKYGRNMATASGPSPHLKAVGRLSVKAAGSSSCDYVRGIGKA